jgi:hypothetical protein
MPGTFLDRWKIKLTTNESRALVVFLKESRALAGRRVRLSFALVSIDRPCCHRPACSPQFVLFSIKGFHYLASNYTRPSA